MTIKKAYYVIYRGNKVELCGNSEKQTICPGRDASVAEFDTEAEMLEYIQTNNLIIPEVEDEMD